MKTVNDFNFFVPFETIEKGTDNKGTEVYKFKGVASDGTEDTDGEFLDPNGFDLSNFTTVNWNHMQEPKYIIGEPTKHVLKNGKLEVEGIIYPESEVGQQVIDLMKTMKKSSEIGNRLGISVEGKALVRDSINPKRVTKAKITGFAICPHPKNPNTWADLITKGISYKENDFDVIEKSERGTISKYIVDVINSETGKRYTIDQDFKIEVIDISKADKNVIASKHFTSSSTSQSTEPNFSAEGKIIRDESGIAKAEQVYLRNIKSPTEIQKAKARKFAEKYIGNKNKVKKSVSTESAAAVIPEDLEGANKKLVKAIIVVAQGYQQGLISLDYKNKIAEKINHR
jgi:hypothetical protein